MSLIHRIKSFFDKGTDYVDSESDKRLVFYINIICIFSLLIIIPIIFISNYLANDFGELLFVMVIFCLYSTSYIINTKGHSQTSLILLIFGIAFLSCFIVNISSAQTAVPIILLLAALSSILFVKKSVWRYLLFAIAFCLYSYLNYYQITEKKFDMTEYVISLLSLLLFTITLDFIAKKRNIFEAKIIEQKKILEEKNDVIKKTSEELLSLQEQNFKNEIYREKERNESIFNNNLIQIKLKKELVNELNSILKSKSYETDLKSSILKLNQEIELQKNMNLLDGSLENLNSPFFKKLQLKHPNITRTDKEYCVFIKQSLTSKEIALIKSTTINTVNVAKTRLRKKLNLKTNQDILPYLLSIE